MGERESGKRKRERSILGGEGVNVSYRVEITAPDETKRQGRWGRRNTLTISPKEAGEYKVK
ncbi:MAG: hypothetical protein ACLU1U_03955 [Lachnospiraceae bacterium]